MGVPGLFTWLQSISPQSVVDVQQGEDLSREVDYLYIDGNGCLHETTQFIHNYGSHKRVIDPYGSLTLEEKNMKVYEIFFRSIVDLTKILKPKKVLYIAIDGPAPLAKQNQQRQRRYGRSHNTPVSVSIPLPEVTSHSSVSKKSDEPDVTTTPIENVERDASVSVNTDKNRDMHPQEQPPQKYFDSNCITPGTVFMYNLSLYLKKAIKNRISDATSKKKGRGITLRLFSIHQIRPAKVNTNLWNTYASFQ